MNPSTPSQKGEFDSCSTRYPCATACIQVPVFERKAPDQKSRKLRCRSARNISLRPRSRRASIFGRVDMNNVNNIAAVRAPNLPGAQLMSYFAVFLCGLGAFARNVPAKKVGSRKDAK